MNAADPGEYEIAKRHEKRRVSQARADLHAVVSMPEGRRMLNWMLNHLKPAGNLWNANAAITGFNAARCDVALFLEDCIDQVDPDARLLMLKEMRDREKQDNAELEAYRLGRKPNKPANENDAGLWR